LALGTAALLAPRPSAAQNPIKDVVEDVREAAAYILGMESYVFGFPLVMMEVTRQVMTAAPTAGEYSAPRVD
jgi:hypothetical protein